MAVFAFPVRFGEGRITSSCRMQIEIVMKSLLVQWCTYRSVQRMNSFLN